MPRMLVIGWEQGCSCSCTTRMLGAALALEKAQVLGQCSWNVRRQGMPARQPLNRNRFVVCSCCYRVTDASTTDAMCIRDVVYLRTRFSSFIFTAS
jgi:hypothetical protein